MKDTDEDDAKDALISVLKDIACRYSIFVVKNTTLFCRTYIFLAKKKLTSNDFV